MQQAAEPVGGTGRIEADHDAAGLEHREQRHQPLDPAIEQQPDLGARHHPLPAQVARQPVGRAVELEIAQATLMRPGILHHGDRFRRTRHLLLEQPVQRTIRICRHRPLAEAGEALPLGRIEQGQGVEAWLWIRGHGGEQAAQRLELVQHGLAQEQLGVVFARQPPALGTLDHEEVQVIQPARRVRRQVDQAEAVMRAVLDEGALENEVDREERVAGQVAPGLQQLDQRLHRQVLVVQRPLDDVLCADQQLGEGRVAR